MLILGRDIQEMLRKPWQEETCPRLTGHALLWQSGFLPCQRCAGYRELSRPEDSGLLACPWEGLPPCGDWPLR